MNKVVQTQALAAEVPKRFRGGIDPSKKVTVTVTEDSPPERVMTLDEIFSSCEPPFMTREEIDHYIRDLREDRDE
jgi:hypothetical protein